MYGFPLRGSFKDLVHDIMIAYAYAEQNLTQFCFTREDYTIDWNSYLSFIPIVSKQDCIAVWPDLFPNTSLEEKTKEEYRKILKKIFQPIPRIKEKIIHAEIVVYVPTLTTIDETDCYVFTDDAMYHKNPTLQVQECDPIVRVITMIWMMVHATKVIGAPKIVELLRNEYSKKISFLQKMDVSSYRDMYQKDKMVCIPCISPMVLSTIQKELQEFPWWMYAIMPNEHTWKPKYYSIQDSILATRFEECKQHLVDKHFCYRFKRTINDHYEVCKCIACKLDHTVRSEEVTDFLSSIVGEPLSANEVFLSCYSKDDFLSIHQDIKKGDIAVTFSLSDWSPVYGGILHFCEKDVIVKSISPVAGNATIFYLDPEHGMEHFVSPVCVDKNRYTITAWYSFKKEFKK